MEHSESESKKKERLLGKLREAAIEYKEDRNKGWAQLGFPVRVESGEIQVWYQEPRQVAEVTDEEVTFAEGDTLPIEFVEDVISLDIIEE